MHTDIQTIETDVQTIETDVQDDTEDDAACDQGLEEAYYVVFFGCSLNDSLLYQITLIGAIEAVMPQIDAVLVAIRPSQVPQLATLPCATDLEYIFGPGNFGDGRTHGAMRVLGRTIPRAQVGVVPASSVLLPVNSFTDNFIPFEALWYQAIIQTANQV
jgi:hypothetical protein